MNGRFCYTNQIVFRKHDILKKKQKGDRKMNQKKINSSKKLSAEILAGASLKMSKMAANSACCYIYHQPKMPAALKNMRKF